MITDYLEIIDQLIKTPDEAWYRYAENYINNLTPYENEQYFQTLLSALNLQLQNAAQGIDDIVGKIGNEAGEHMDDLVLKIDKDYETINPYWNSSIETILANIIKLKEGDYSFLNDHVELDDLEDADAGLDFDTPPWVKPNKNINDKTFDEVRSIDKVKKLLQLTKNLQYTREETNDTPSWLRLLMPKNSRRIVIEDLNRNFWVIGQVLAALCSGIFGGDIPLSSIIEDLLKEITGLWENIIYLWIATIIYKQTISSKVRVIEMPLPNSTIQNHIKFDNFIETDTSNPEMILHRVKYLIDKFPNTNLLILPFLRRGNYKHNYFNEQYYPYMIVHNALKEENYIVKLKYSGQGEIDFGLSINPVIFDKWIYAAREEDKGYIYTYPLSGAAEIFEDEQIYYYGAIRTQIDIKTYIDNNNNIYIESFAIIGRDAIGEAISGEGYYLKTKNKTALTPDLQKGNPQKDLLEYSYSGNYLIENEGVFTTNYIVNGRIRKDNESLNYPTEWGETFIAPFDSGYYLGEIPSSNQISSENFIDFVGAMPYQIKGRLIKIGNYLPKDFLGDETYLEVDKSIIHEQYNSADTKTDYIYNYSLGFYGDTNCPGDIQNRIEQLFGDPPGYDKKLTNEQCNFYVPTGNDNLKINLVNRVYNDIVGEESQKISKENMKEIGKKVIGTYLLSNIEEQEDIIYFMAAFGAQTWHNNQTTASGTPTRCRYQTYWEINVLTDLFMFIPEAYIKNITTLPEGDRYDVINNQEVRIGVLFHLMPLNTQETFTRFLSGSGYGDNNLYEGTSKWRLPYLIPSSTSQGYAFLNKLGESFVLKIDQATLSTHQELNNLYSAYIQDATLENKYALELHLSKNFTNYSNEGIILKDMNINSPSGTWCVFDGKSGDTSNNEHQYKINQYREVAYTNFNTNNNEISFSNYHMRKNNWTTENIVDYSLSNPRNGIMIPLGADIPSTINYDENGGYYFWSNTPTNN